MPINRLDDTAISLCTTLKNLSGSSKFFGFIPPHGRRLAAGEEVTIAGGIDQLCQNPRARRSLLKALTSGHISIVHTPMPHLEDDDQAWVPQLDNGVLTWAAPSWEPEASPSV